MPGAVKKRKRTPRPPPPRTVYLVKEFLVSPPSHYKEVPTNDPRLTFPHMIVETFHTGDLKEYASLMRRLCDPQLQYYMQYDGKQNPYGPNRRQFVGVEEYLELAKATLQSGPDCVSRIYEGPHVYYDEATNESFASYKVLTSLTKTGVIADSGPEYQVNRLPSHLKMVTSYICGRFTYSMNAQNKMTKFCLLFKYMMYDPSIKHIPGSNDAKLKKKEGKKKI